MMTLTILKINHQQSFITGLRIKLAQQNCEVT